MLIMMRPQKMVVVIAPESDAPRLQEAVDRLGLAYTVDRVVFRASGQDHPSVRIGCLVERGPSAPLLKAMRELQASGFNMLLFEYEAGVPI